jgi:2-polyprenyl-3-methyl-5-hydroxy-6-metoxy-1,4-benzoquinol methylase
MIRLINKNLNTPEYWNKEFDKEIEINRQRIEPERFEKTANFIKDGSSVLDLGCGKGEFLQFLKIKKPNCKMMGIDFSSSAIEYAKKTIPDIEFAVADVQNISFYKSLLKRFDYVVSFEVIEHLDIPLKFISEVECVLKDGGWFILSTPYNNMIGGGAEHIYSFDYFDMCSFFRHPNWTLSMLSRYGRNFSNMYIQAKLNEKDNSSI